MIQVENLSKSFQNVTAVKNINFHIQKGEIVGLLGPNGAGKTTTMRMLTGFYKPTSGKITIGGYSVETDRLEVQKKIGYLPENSALYTDMLVCDYLLFIASAFKLTGDVFQKNLDYAVSATGIEKYFYRPISQLSKGYKQRVGIAATLIHDPSLLILDEPTSGLDPNQIIEIQKLIMSLAKDKTIILSTHILNEIENTCQRAIIISEGQIVLDEPLKNINALKKGGFKFHILLAGRITDAVEVLKKELGMEDIQLVSLDDGDTKLQLTAANHIGEQIYQCAARHGWPLKELFAEKESLESIFQSLTSAGGGK